MPAPLRADRSGKLPLSLQSANNSQRGGFLSLSHLGFSSFKVLAITVPLPPPTIGPFVLSRPSLLEMPHSILLDSPEQSHWLRYLTLFAKSRPPVATTQDSSAPYLLEREKLAEEVWDASDTPSTIDGALQPATARAEVSLSLVRSDTILSQIALG